MKRIALLSIVAASSLFATNGDNLIGLGAESRALGGTGIAMFTGAENALTNPALLGKIKTDHEFSFGGTAFKADVKVSTTNGSVTDSNPMADGEGVSKTSDEGMSVIPAISIANRLSDNLVFGLGMYGTAGMGTDWRGSDVNASAGHVDLYNMRSSLMLMQFAPSLAYTTGNFGIGVTGIIQYGSLSIDYDTKDSSGNKTHIGNGTSNDFGFGYQVGAYVDVTKTMTLGAIYKSPIDMEYKDQISKAAAAFGYGGAGLAGKSDHLEQPAEYGVGIAYTMGSMTYTADVKSVRWGDAKGYEDFGWENQTVYAVGAKYQANSYWLGLGYNHGKNPIPNNTNSTDVATGTAHVNGTMLNTDGDTMNLFNYAMFPATIENMYTIGGGLDIGKGINLGLAFTYAPKVSDTVSGTTVGVGDITTEHSQTATSLSVTYKF